MPVGAPTVMVAGETPNDLNSDKLGEFARRIGHEVNGRPIYGQVGNDNRMIWCARPREAPRWEGVVGLLPHAHARL